MKAYQKLTVASPTVKQGNSEPPLAQLSPTRRIPPSPFPLQFIGMQALWWYIVGRLGCTALLYMSAK